MNGVNILYFININKIVRICVMIINVDDFKLRKKFIVFLKIICVDYDMIEIKCNI